MDNNQRLKIISTVLKLSRSEISAACKAGGCPVSASRVRLFLLGAGANLENFIGKKPTGYTKYDPMSDIEFDAFCLGLFSLYRVKKYS